MTGAERLSTPARRFDSSHLERFAASYDFPLDPFQQQGCAAVQDGRGVLVAAPTGAGKTVVGEFAAYLALNSGRKCFYTTPIKALSNQKYADLVARHGADKVGLLTGDSSINGEAPVVVMTTEVLRNMLYAESPTLAGLGFVVMDEVHYLADRFRGAVWEEVIIQLPEAVQLIALSATVSNAEEFGDWLREVRGDTSVIVEEHRPVPLWQHMMVGQQLFDLFADRDGDDRLRINPVLRQRIQRLREDRRGQRLDEGAPRGRRGRERHGRGGPVRAGRPPRGPSRAEVIEALDRDGLLPAITFIFSRVGCEAAVSQLLAWGLRLVPPEEGERIRRLVEERVRDLPEEDLTILGYWDFVEGLSRGFAAHHAGMLPTFREIVEELFIAGRIRAVFATETLALGVNMPARTVVLEKLVKFNGETHAPVTPAEFTQLTGRAGRRGIDVEGHAVVLYGRDATPEEVGGLASTRTYPLRSSFVPTANMAVNLVDRLGRGTARSTLEASFAQFQADRSVVGVARTIAKNEEGLEGYAEAMRCHLGDFAEYAALRRELSDAEKAASRARSASRRAAAAVSLTELHPGDVIRVRDGRRAGLALVLSMDTPRRGDPQPFVLTTGGRTHRLTESDLDGPVAPIMQLPVPKRFNHRDRKARADLAATLRAKAPRDPGPTEQPPVDDGDEAAREQVARLREQVRAHPCHDCPYREQHARWAERWWQLHRETEGLRRKVDSRTHTVARTFDRVCDLLGELGYLTDDGQRVTEDGRMLQRIYAEKDLLVAECLRQDVWRGLDAPSLAAVVSALVHTSRGDGPDPDPRIPSKEVGQAIDTAHDVWAGLVERAARHRLTPMAEPDPSIVWPVHRWAAGGRLETVLRGSDLSAGDFVRRCKQIVDLLDQVADAAPDDALRRTAKTAVDAVMRGVVAADRLD
ncbi:DEAD/DEAH box helicase [Calidifontibacter sp. DB0510]|uniref:DEAD/DEAH box helicase n=1 Tax=Metallococcus carri TaxID=1656884 RepID=A0A967EG97_9MICO|nr:DEAD/DEAH box helicase [Metallococcus carri]NHN54798.1 DEAD/DEAH box helicase [Metallococcus carri]NOP37143.1 DEAD/DEAH box helicase [Calidifontibacter sp. DB2511S]